MSEAVADANFEIDTSKYFTPLGILDYIYAVLHSPSYRERYKEFLKTDFPRVPWPSASDASPEEKEQARIRFWKLVRLGGELRQYHLMEHPKSGESTVTYPAGGDNIIRRKMTKTSIGFEASEASVETGPSNLKKKQVTGRVWINDEQYFDNVPRLAWEFYIGGYQPAQKWLKDRRDRELIIEDIQHYRKIVTALTATQRLMGEIDNI